MLIENGLSVQRDKKILKAGIVFFVFFVLGGSLWAFSAYFLLEKEESRLGFSGNKLKEKRIDFVNPLLIEEKKELLPLPDLSMQLVVLEHIPRPDLERGKGVFLLGLEGNCQKRMVCDQEKVYLNCASEKEITFSEEKTPFWVEHIVREGGMIVASFHMEYLGDNGECLFRREERVVLSEKKDFGGHGEILPIVAYLEKIKLYEPDLVIGMYGGKSFEDIKSSYRMCNGNDLFFIKPGDLLIWQNGRLKRETKGGTKGFPLLWIRSIDPQKCEMVLWDSAGLYGKPIIMPVGKKPPFSTKIQDVILKLHQRSDTSVTALVQNRNAILRKGDWFLCSKGGLRKLRSLAEVKEFLRYALKGELFIFDGIVKKEGGLQAMFVGNLFNEERTEVRKIEIPLSERKKKKE